jgi:hypothetical protein
VLRRKLADRLHPASRIIIIVAALLILLLALVFFIWLPVKPSFQQPGSFGGPAQSSPSQAVPPSGRPFDSIR